MRTARLENDSRIVFADRERVTPLGSNRPWPPPLFQMPTTSFWNTAATSGRPSRAPIPETSRSGDMTSLGVATGVPRPGRTLSWDRGEAGSARTGCRQSCRPCRSRNPACNEPGRLASALGSAPARTPPIAVLRNTPIMRSTSLCKAQATRVRWAWILHDGDSA
jgi:hypothetical protein